MKKVLALACGLAISNAALAAGGSAWGYSGKKGPANWAQLSADYSACDGENQSPINLTGFIEADLNPIKFYYRDGGSNTIVNNGHTVQVNYPKGSHITLDGEVFSLLQFHLHAPSENHINGQSYPMEAHFVHADRKGNLAVVAVMFEEGTQNKELAKAWSTMPEDDGDKHKITGGIDAEALMPDNRDYYRFNGSLTTPPCSEGVRWLVIKEAITASEQQIEAFKDVLHHPNNRPIQAVNARPVLQ